MSNGEVIRHPPPSSITGPLTYEELAAYFYRRCDLTYRKLESLTLTNVDMYQSLLTGALIRNSTFDRVVFSRSDLNGVRIETSKFISCDFTSCDFRSSIFANCSFEQCVLSSAFIDDCEFQSCTFNNCSFTVSGLTHCLFKESSLQACDLTQASFLHNRLYATTISNMVLGNCALQYVILRNCILEGVTLSAESFGAMLGLTSEQLSAAKLVYLGVEDSNSYELIKLLFEEYGKRRWYIGQLVLALNFQVASVVNAFDAYLLLSKERFIEFGFASGEELEFLGDILQEYALFERLPFLSLLNVLDWCTELDQAVKGNNEPLSESSGDSLSTLVSRAVLLSNTLLDKLDAASPRLQSSEEDQPLCVNVNFNRRPDIPLTGLLNSLALEVTTAAHKSYRISFKLGSYSEVIFTTLFTLMAFQAFLFLVNGCIIQLTELKHRAKVLARRKAPKSYSELALSPVQSASPVVLSVLSGLTSYAKSLGWIRNADLSGYGPSNITSVKEVECENQGLPNAPNEEQNR